jgi:DHA1 family bicyclomycin/chloramphenicol resistance-like MFS transporter
MALTMAATAFINSSIVMKLGARRVSHAALIAYIWPARSSGGSPGPAKPCGNSCPHDDQHVPVRLSGRQFLSIALQPFARTAGAAASIQVFIRIVGGSALGIVIGNAFDGSARPLATAQVSGGADLDLLLYSEKGQLFSGEIRRGCPSRWFEEEEEVLRALRPQTPGLSSDEAAAAPTQRQRPTPQGNSLRRWDVGADRGHFPRRET